MRATLLNIALPAVELPDS